MLHTNFLYNTIARRMNKFSVQFVRRAQFAEARAPTNVCVSRNVNAGETGPVPGFGKPLCLVIFFEYHKSLRAHIVGIPVLNSERGIGCHGLRCPKRAC
jgi:hypothetical protein